MCLRLAAVGLAPAPARSALQARVGFVSALDERGAESFVRAMLDDLRSRGYTEPATLAFVPRFASNDLSRIPQLVKEVEAQQVGLIVTHAAATTIVVTAPHMVPVVYEFSADPSSAGI